jgi:hypothetical protein
VQSVNRLHRTCGESFIDLQVSATRMFCNQEPSIHKSGEELEDNRKNIPSGLNAELDESIHNFSEDSRRCSEETLVKQIDIANHDCPP